MATDIKLADGNAAAAVVRGERQLRRAHLQAVVERNKGGKLAWKAGDLLKGIDRIEAVIGEAGGEDGLVRIICARVLGGQTVGEFCDEHEVERGLVGELLTSTPERYGRYRRALEWVADGLVAETVRIAATPQMGVTRRTKADGSEEVTEEDMLGHRKLLVDTHLKVAARYDRARFGQDGGAGVTVNVPVVNPGDTTELARKVAFLLRKGVEEAETVDAVVVDTGVDTPPEAA